MGKLIVIEGLDGAGKETQSRLLAESLRKDGYNVKQISFPDYQSWSSELVKGYLSGKLGDDPNKLSPYAVHAFYAADRYVSYINEWRDFYNQEDSIVIADRYMESSMLYQSMSIGNEIENVSLNDPDLLQLEINEALVEFAKFVKYYETELLGLPKADKVVFLSVTPSVSKIMRQMRDNNKHGSSTDIHEDQDEILTKLYDRYKIFSDNFDWDVIECSDYICEHGRDSIEMIHNIVYQHVNDDVTGSVLL